MAAATAVAFSTPSGLASSSLHGQKLKITPTKICMRSKRADLVSAKYGDKSVYFDLEDISNTTGNWDMYGSDAASPYNPLQSKFFETFAGAFTKRGLLLQFLLLGYAGAIAYAGANSSPNLLPIKKGPQQPPQPGPRGKI